MQHSYSVIIYATRRRLRKQGALDRSDTSGAVAPMANRAANGNAPSVNNFPPADSMDRRETFLEIFPFGATLDWGRHCHRVLAPKAAIPESPVADDPITPIGNIG